MKEDKDKEETQEQAAETIKEEGTEAELEKLLDEDKKEEQTREEAETEETPEQPTEEETRPTKKKKQEEEEITEERTYTIPLGKALIKPPKKRAPRAMRMVRAFITKHMKLDAKTATDDEEEKETPTLTITKEVNEKIWGKGIEKPPRKIRIRATKDKDGNVTVHLAEET